MLSEMVQSVEEMRTAIDEQKQKLTIISEDNKKGAHEKEKNNKESKKIKESIEDWKKKVNEILE